MLLSMSSQELHSIDPGILEVYRSWAPRKSMFKRIPTDLAKA